MLVNGINMSLAQYVEHCHKDYINRPQWQWEDEGIIYAIQDYESSIPYADWTDEDKRYLIDNDLEEVADILFYVDALKGT